MVVNPDIIYKEFDCVPVNTLGVREDGFPLINGRPMDLDKESFLSFIHEGQVKEFDGDEFVVAPVDADKNKEIEDLISMGSILFK
jgi:hypothetical protein